MQTLPKGSYGTLSSNWSTKALWGVWLPSSITEIEASDPGVCCPDCLPVKPNFVLSTEDCGLGWFLFQQDLDRWLSSHGVPHF